jgi:hypothetical protein
MGMFSKLEKEKREKLIFLYEQYLLNGNLKGIESQVEEVTFDSGYPVFSEVVNTAGFMIEEALIKEISIVDAIAMLDRLKSPLKEGA